MTSSVMTTPDLLEGRFPPGELLRSDLEFERLAQRLLTDAMTWLASGSLQRRNEQVSGTLLPGEMTTELPGVISTSPVGSSCGACREYYTVRSAATGAESIQPAEVSTRFRQPIKDVGRSVDRLFEQADDDDLEDGVQGAFSAGLVSLVTKFGKHAVAEVAYLVLSGKANTHVASTALRWLGRMNHPETQEQRFWLLTKALSSQSLQIRDSAVVALEYMGDPAAISALQDAAGRETSTRLGEYMRLVVDDLKS